MLKFPQRRDSRACIAPQSGRRVYDYYNGMLADEAEDEVEAHLLACDDCYRATLMLDHAYQTLWNQRTTAAAVNPAVEQVQQNVPINVPPDGFGARSPAFYLVVAGVGGLGLMGILTVGAYGLYRRYRRKHAAGASPRSHLAEGFS
ncbi:MAG TPA: zf-HC2 domain-containing protein [Pyrinomonadaceae bacterium]|nr:zf-HC2 domain-containing protein [Pyrinomonadaceae bacterium]